MPENRNDRLASDYREMLKIQDRPYLSWIAVKGEAPYVEEYLLSIRLRTYALRSDGERYLVGTIDRCTVKVTLWDSYPHMAPNIRMLSMPPVFHPDWYSKGTYCSPVPWCSEDSLKDHIMRLLESLRYEPSLITQKAPANYKALDWFLKNRNNTSWFPSDHTILSENTPEQVSAAEKEAENFTQIIDSWPIGQRKQ